MLSPIQLYQLLGPGIMKIVAEVKSKAPAILWAILHEMLCDVLRLVIAATNTKTS